MGSFGENILKLLFPVLVFLIFKYKSESSKRLSLMMPITLNRNYKAGLLFYFLFSLCLGVSLFDFKGAKVKGEKKSSKEKITILIDYSSSMRVQDVGTSRYKLALNFVKDFIRNMPGYNYRVVIYADKGYKVVPFTSDINYVQTKISAIRSDLFPDGGSDLHLGLKESFVGDSTGGTVLLISDFENLDSEKINSLIDEKKINLFSVIVGTSEGGRIPMGRNNLLRGYVTKNGKKVISKADPIFLNDINHKNKFILNKNKYPLDPLGEAMKRSFVNANAEQSTDYLRKRYMPYFVLLGCIFLLLSLFFRNIKKPVGFIMITLLNMVEILHANDPAPQTNIELNRYANEMFFEEGKDQKDIPETIYKELSQKNLSDVNKVSVSFNLSTALLRNSKRKESIDLILDSEIISKKVMGDKLRSNIVNLLKQSAQSKGSTEGDSESSDKNQNQQSDSNSNKSSSNKKQDYKKQLSEKDRRLLEKLVGDDQVSQAEYIKKKIKKSSRRNEIRW